MPISFNLRFARREMISNVFRSRKFSILSLRRIVTQYPLLNPYKWICLDHSHRAIFLSLRTCVELPRTPGTKNHRYLQSLFPTLDCVPQVPVAHSNPKKSEQHSIWTIRKISRRTSKLFQNLRCTIPTWKLLQPEAKGDKSISQSLPQRSGSGFESRVSVCPRVGPGQRRAPQKRWIPISRVPPAAAAVQLSWSRRQMRCCHISKHEVSMCVCDVWERKRQRWKWQQMYLCSVCVCVCFR